MAGTHRLLGGGSGGLTLGGCSFIGLFGLRNGNKDNLVVTKEDRPCALGNRKLADLQLVAHVELRCVDADFFRNPGRGTPYRNKAHGLLDHATQLLGFALSENPDRNLHQDRRFLGYAQEVAMHQRALNRFELKITNDGKSLLGLVAFD